MGARIVTSRSQSCSPRETRAGFISRANMQEPQVTQLPASSDLYARVGPERFRSLAARAVQAFTGLSPAKARLAAAECAHRAWVSARVGGAWSSVLLVIDEGWRVVLVPPGCTLQEGDADP